MSPSSTYKSVVTHYPWWFRGGRLQWTLTCWEIRWVPAYFFDISMSDWSQTSISDGVSLACRWTYVRTMKAWYWTVGCVMKSHSHCTGSRYGVTFQTNTDNTATVTKPESHPSTWKLYTCMTSPTRIPCHDVRCLAAKSALMRRRQSLFCWLRVWKQMSKHSSFLGSYICALPPLLLISPLVFFMFMSVGECFWEWEGNTVNGLWTLM